MKSCISMAGLTMSLLLALVGCGHSGLAEGGLYGWQNKDGTYSVFKILKLEDSVVHVRFYSNQFSSLPVKIDESTLYMAGLDRKPNENLGIGHAPMAKKAVDEMNPKFIQQSTVKEEELEGYKIWKGSN